jgi:hypothetical protein
VTASFWDLPEIRNNSRAQIKAALAVFPMTDHA